MNKMKYNYYHKDYKAIYKERIIYILMGVIIASLFAVLYIFGDKSIEAQFDYNIHPVFATPSVCK